MQTFGIGIVTCIGNVTCIGISISISVDMSISISISVDIATLALDTAIAKNQLHRPGFHLGQGREAGVLENVIPLLRHVPAHNGVQWSSVQFSALNVAYLPFKEHNALIQSLKQCSHPQTYFYEAKPQTLVFSNTSGRAHLSFSYLNILHPAFCILLLSTHFYNFVLEVTWKLTSAHCVHNAALKRLQSTILKEQIAPLDGSILFQSSFLPPHIIIRK
jgi:hypothetical protein